MTVEEKKLPPFWVIQEYQTVSSTMDVAGQNQTSKTVIWALNQTQGRGKYHRAWISGEGNLYCSLILDPGVSLQRWGELSFISALAVGDTLQTYLPKREIGYKWPNDVLVSQQKIAGILLESHPFTSSSQPLIIIGIGINVSFKPLHTSYPATCLQERMSQPLPSLKQILFKLIHAFDFHLKSWQAQGFKLLRDKWLAQACFLNQTILLQNQHLKEFQRVEGIFQGIDETGRLLLKLPNNVMKTYSTGDVFFPSA